MLSEQSWFNRLLKPLSKTLLKRHAKNLLQRPVPTHFVSTLSGFTAQAVRTHSVLTHSVLTLSGFATKAVRTNSVLTLSVLTLSC